MNQAAKAVDKPLNTGLLPKIKSMRTLDKLFVSLLLAYAALLLVWLVSQPLPPLQDYEDWVYQGWVGAGLLMGEPAVWARFATVHYPVPNSASQVVLTMLTSAVGAVVAAKIFIGFLLIGLAAVCYLSARRWKMGDPGVSAFVLFCLFGVNTMFFDGYINYQLSILVFVCFLLLQNRSSAGRIFATGLVLFFCHAAIFFAFVLVVFFEAIRERRVFSSMGALSPGLALLVWYVLARDKVTASHLPALYGGFVHHLEYSAYTFTKLGPFHNLGDFTRHSLASRAHVLYLAGVALNLVFAILLLYAIVSLLIRQPRRDPLLLTAAVLFSFFMLLPGVIFGVVNLGERMLYPCLIVFFFRARSLKIPKLLAATIVCGSALTAIQLFTMPAAKGPDTAMRLPAPGPMAQPYYVRFGLYNSDLYRFDSYRVFLERPDMANMPQIGFQTSIFRNRREHTSTSNNSPDIPSPSE